LTPCGYAIRDDLAEATRLAIAGDPVSAFGGIVALNRVVDEATAVHLAEIFLDIVIAPGFSPSALALLSKKKQLRLLELSSMSDRPAHAKQIRTIAGGMVIQEQDQSRDDASAWRTVTKRAPTESERRDAVFAWRAARFVKSNAIVLVRDLAVRGVGAGQPNRVESVRIAVNRAGEHAKGAALASDAFFPFADGPEAAMSAGVTCIVQPGGSVRDDEVIAAADAADVAMLFTGVRHFLH
jgi:phosphoribosylaminoimidazolecarboxamide formyltransferase/IMP cyclohydrolase